MQEPKRNKKYHKDIQEVVEVLKFYMGDTKSKELISKLRGVEDKLTELSMEKKEDHIRFAKKLKMLFKRAG